MPLFRCGLYFLVLLCLSFVCRAQEPNFPTNDEINLLLTQTERAVGQYKPLLDQEESLFGKKGKEAVAKDREVVQGRNFNLHYCCGGGGGLSRSAFSFASLTAFAIRA